MPNPLKAKIKQTLVFSMNIEQLFAQLHHRLGAGWQIKGGHLNSDTIAFHALREGIEISGHLERWQGTESRLHLDGEVLSKVPYESWREWTGITTFAAIIVLWFTLSFLPLTEIPFLNLYLIMTSSESLLSIFTLLVLALFLGLPIFAQRYFSQLSPDIRRYAEKQKELSNFVSELKSLQNLPSLDTSRLEERDESLNLVDTPEASKSLSISKEK